LRQAFILATKIQGVMGRSYLFECSRCGYRTKVSGRQDRGLDFSVQTILCRDCKELYDAVVRVRMPEQAAPAFKSFGKQIGNNSHFQKASSAPPTFQAVLNRLPHSDVTRFRWVRFKPQCPVSPLHKVEKWDDPNKCPRCGLYLEKNVLPYRIWD